MSNSILDFVQALSSAEEYAREKQGVTDLIIGSYGIDLRMSVKGKDQYHHIQRVLAWVNLVDAGNPLPVLKREIDLAAEMLQRHLDGAGNGGERG